MTNPQLALLLHLAGFLPFATEAAQQNPAFARNTSFEIPLISGGNWGSSTRTADHATVAINDNHDILIAYHTTRADLTNQVSGAPAFHEPLKQVEIAFLEYNSQSSEWSLEDRVLIGSTDYDPRNSQYQNLVRCERPDVIAVGNRFFVVWTRRYDRKMPGWEMEPAVLECAWVEWSGSALQIYNGGQTIGRGYPLDSGYTVRECAGVPDAVILEPGGSTDPTVGVVYPHQTDIGDVDPQDWMSQGDGIRLCDLRLIVTSLDSNNQIPNPGSPVTLIDDIQFDGSTAPSGQDSAGLILPDLARGQRDPVTLAYRFWLAYEEQFMIPNQSVPDGRIRLQLWEQNSSGAWGTLTTLNLGNSSSPNWRRRPMASSHPEDAGGLEFVSLTFSRANTAGNGDVVHDEWGFTEAAGLNKVARPAGHAFDNDADDHNRPTVLHGRTTPLVRRIYVERNESPSQILEYDVDEDDLNVKAGTDEAMGRPAVAYRAGSGSVPDDVVLTWEERAEGVSYFRIWIRVD